MHIHMSTTNILLDSRPPIPKPCEATLTIEGGERRPIARLPEALRGRVGARVWFAGPLDSPDAFGVIE